MIPSRGRFARPQTPKKPRPRCRARNFSALARRLHLLTANRETAGVGRLREGIKAGKVTDFASVVAAAGTAFAGLPPATGKSGGETRSRRETLPVFFAVFRHHRSQSARPPAAGNPAGTGSRSHHFGETLTTLVMGPVSTALAAFFPLKNWFSLPAPAIRCPAVPARRHPPLSGAQASARSFVVRSSSHGSAAFGRPGIF